jgi:hypothetical protein
MTIRQLELQEILREPLRIQLNHHVAGGTLPLTFTGSFSFHL